MVACLGESLIGLLTIDKAMKSHDITIFPGQATCTQRTAKELARGRTPVPNAVSAVSAVAMASSGKKGNLKKKKKTMEIFDDIYT